MKKKTYSKEESKAKMQLSDTALRLQDLRRRCGLSIRQLAAEADVTAGMISFIERGESSPSLVTLEKILDALGTNLTDFFSNGSTSQTGCIYAREKMKTVSDIERTYSILLPKRADIGIEMLDEYLQPSGEPPPYEILKGNVAGYVLEGELTLEVEGEEKEQLRTGDAFHIKKGTKHRGYAVGGGQARLLTVAY